MNYYDKLKQIEGLTKVFSDSNANQLRHLLKNGPELENDFYGIITTCDWFGYLKENGCFDPNRITFDEGGNAIFWSPLNYLERVSQQVKDNPDENGHYGGELIRIIDDLFKYSKKRVEDIGKPINQMHIWWYCIKILNNVPSDIIKEKLSINTFRAWLCELSSVREANGLAMHEISEKLLAKFLEGEGAAPYAEVIMDVITGVRESDSPRPAIGDKDALLAMDSYWLMKAFEGHTETIVERCSKETVYGLADKLKTALEYGRKENHVSIHVGKKWYQIKLERMFSDESWSESICYEAIKYGCVVGQYSKKDVEDMKENGGEFSLYRKDTEEDLSRYSVEGETREGVKAAVEEDLPEKIKWHNAENFTDKLGYLYDGLFEDYSQVWCKSLASMGTHPTNDAKETLTVMFRDILLATCSANKAGGREILKELLSERYRFPIFKRFILLCIDRHWSDYADLFQKFIDQDGNVLRKDEWEVELQNVMLNHCNELSKDHKKRLNELIDDIPDYYREKGPRFEGHWKYKWLSPLKNNSDFTAAYEEARKRAGVKEDKPYDPEYSQYKSGAIGHVSPTTADDLLGKESIELVDYLKKFVGADEWGMMEGKADEEGLAETLQKAVQKEPEKFTDALDDFLDVPYMYLYRTLMGFKDVWNEKRDLDWNSIFKFCLNYLQRKDFLAVALKAQGKDSGDGKYIYFINALVDLIESGSRNDKHSFDPKLFPIVDEIFDVIYPLLKAEKNPDTQRDALTYSLNTTLGRVINSFIIYSLRVKRVDRETKADKCAEWGDKKYEKYFEKGIEAYVWFGRYLPSVRFVDRVYVEGKIKDFSQRSSDDNEWRMFMEGYLSGAYVYDDVYELMRPNCIKAIDEQVFDENIDKRMVEHITIGYLRGNESLDEQNEDGSESLFRKMLDEASGEKKRERWLVVPGYLWSISKRTLRPKEHDLEDKPLDEKTAERVIAFWRWTYKHPDKIKVALGDKYNDFLGKLADLTIYLPRIDEEAGEWLLLSSPQADRHHMSSFFMEYLTKFEDEESVGRIGEIFLKVLENSTPTFRKEDITLIINKLYKLGKKGPKTKENANKICNTYGRRGEHFLREIFDKNNPE